MTDTPTADLHPDLPELFDLDYGDFDDDLPLYEHLARRQDGPVLELGVGTGRAATALARSGLEVWGIDTSQAMLRRARCKAGRDAEVRLTHGDMRAFDLDCAFALIYAGYGALHHLLTTDDQLACLRCVRRHLVPDGMFVCDLRPLTSADWETGPSAPLQHDWTRPLARTKETVVKLRSVRADAARQLQHEQHIFDRVAPDGTVRRVTAALSLRFVGRYEMEGLVREAGLSLEGIYGDYDLSPYNGDSPYMITIARRTARETA